MKNLRFVKAFLLLLAIVGNSLAAASPPEKEWAFLIFLNGNNNLAEYGDLNINQLETIGSTKEVDVIVQWAKLGFDKTYRLKVEKDNDPNKVTSPFVETLPRQDMGDYKNLIEFVRWAAVKYPAKRYFVSFWDHGSGWHRDGGAVVRGISHDDYSHNHITTEQMGMALREISRTLGKKVDIVGADACLMAMAEVASELVDSADYFVASEETEPALGWPYHSFYQRWAANPGASTAEISRYLVEEYQKYMVPKDKRVTLSSMQLSQLPQLWDAVRTLARAVTKLPPAEQGQLKAKTVSALSFAYSDYVDIGHWVNRGLTVETSSLPKGVLKAVGDSVSRLVVSNKTSETYKDAEGVSFWVPPTKGEYLLYAEAYKKMRFAKETGWNEVAESLVSLPVCVRQNDGQWATGITGFSSQYGESGWSAKQALGACDTAEYGDHQTAWAPKTSSDTEEFVTLSFANPVHATGAVIRETSGSGFLTKVETVDTEGKTTIVWQGTDSSPLGAISDFTVTWPRTAALVNGLKLSVNTQKNPGVWTEIDSVQLVGTP